MKDKRRSLKTKFWDDNFISNLSSSHKLLYLYLLTNPLTNLLGIYEISKKRIKYDTGLSDEVVTKGLELFAISSKAFFYEDNFIILPNWLKNQDFNKNMMIAARKEFTCLPEALKNRLLPNGSEGLPNGSEGLPNGSEWLPNGSLTYGEIEREVEGEVEREVEGEKKKEIEKRCRLFIGFCNTNLKLNGVERSWTMTDQVLKQFRARIKSGYKTEQFMTAIINAKKIQIHKENNYQYLTPEFFTRTKTLETYGV